MNYTATDYTEMNRVAKELGLRGENGIYTTLSGMSVDLTATAPEREKMLYVIGLTSLKDPQG